MYKAFHYVVVVSGSCLVTLFWMQYEDPMRQEAALKTVPVDELKEKALISLAKVSVSVSYLMLVYFLFQLDFLNIFNITFPWIY